MWYHYVAVIAPLLNEALAFLRSHCEPARRTRLPAPIGAPVFVPVRSIESATLTAFSLNDDGQLVFHALELSEPIPAEDLAENTILTAAQFFSPPLPAGTSVTRHTLHGLPPGRRRAR